MNTLSIERIIWTCVSNAGSRFRAGRCDRGIVKEGSREGRSWWRGVTASWYVLHNSKLLIISTPHISEMMVQIPSAARPTK